MHAEAQKSHGQSLVELSISLMVILLLLVGAVDFGMAFFSYVAMRDAAQEGALFASFEPYHDDNENARFDYTDSINEAEIRARVRASSVSPVDFSDTTRVPDAYITAERTTSVGCEGSTLMGTPPTLTPNAIRVRVEYDYQLMTPLLGAILGSQTIHLTAEVTDTILQPRCP